MGLAKVITLTLLLATIASSSIEQRFAERDILHIKDTGSDPISGVWGPEDVHADGTMEGHEVARIQAVTGARKSDLRTYDVPKENPYRIRYGVYNLKHPRIVDALKEAYQAGVIVQIIVESSVIKGKRYPVDDAMKAIGMPVFVDRKLIPANWEGITGSFMTGAKLGSLYHTKTRYFRWLDSNGNAQRILLTGSLNPGEESMFNDESIMTITDPYLMDRYDLYFDAILARTEKKWVNEFDPTRAINVMFSPDVNGFDVGTKILDWIDEEQEFIMISVFSLNPFTDGKEGTRSLLTQLKAAHDRGVMIVIVTDRKQSDGSSGFGNPFDDMIRKIGKDIIMYEVVNDVGFFNAMHLKDMVLGMSRMRVVTDTANWSQAAFGSCVSIVKSEEVRRTCKAAASAESTLFIEGSLLPGGNRGFPSRVLKHHLSLLDKYWRQIPAQKTGDPAPQEVWGRIVSRFGPVLSFQRTTVFVQAVTQPGEFIEMRAGLCDDNAVCVRTDGAPHIQYVNHINRDTLVLKRSYHHLSWNYGAAMDWTTDGPTTWARGAGAPSYDTTGFGYSWENDVPSARGTNWWKFLAYVDGQLGDWFEFKLVKTAGVGGSVLAWEKDVSRETLDITPAADSNGAPPSRSTKNHRGRLGYITRAIFK